MECTGNCPFDEAFAIFGGVWDAVTGFFDSIIAFLGILFGPIFLIFY